MKIIVDTNIVFSALLSKKNDSKFFLVTTSYEIYSCNYLYVELSKHREKMQNLSKLSEDELLQQMDKILSRINFVNNNVIPTNFFYTAFNICKNIDENDTPFIALSLFLDGYLLTGDKNLYKNINNTDLKTITLQEILNKLL